MERTKVELIGEYFDLKDKTEILFNAFNNVLGEKFLQTNAPNPDVLNHSTIVKIKIIKILLYLSQDLKVLVNPLWLLFLKNMVLKNLHFRVL